MAYKRSRGLVGGPFKVVLYGQVGVGKSTWASKAPKPLVIDPNNRTRFIEYHERALVESWSDVIQVLEDVEAGEFSDVETIVLDELATLEALNHKHILETTKLKELTDDYAAGYKKSHQDFKNLLGRLDIIGKNVIIIGHTFVKKFDNPEGADYDQFKIDCREKIANMLTQWADGVFFARHLRFVENGKDGKTVGIYDEKPIIHTVEDAAYVAKNSYGMKSKISLDFDEFACYLEAAKLSDEQIREMYQEDYEVADLSTAALKQLYVHEHYSNDKEEA